MAAGEVMVKVSTTMVKGDHAVCNPRGMGRMVMRRFDPQRDSWEQLTRLLHRAFARLAALGLHCNCVDQTAAVTRQRALAGECFVAVCNGRIVATLTLESRDPDSPCEHYRHRHVASLHQFGVDPSWQNRGIGKTLLDFASRWAAAHGFTRIALDTPFPASHLLAFYRAQGFGIVDVVRFAGRAYDSAVLSKFAGDAQVQAGYAHASGRCMSSPSV